MIQTYSEANRQREQGGRSFPRGQQSRPAYADNLYRLSKELGSDLVAAAFGVAEPMIRGLTSGREGHQYAQYYPHLQQRLLDAGLPGNWLDQSGPPITKEVQSKFKALAARSNNKAPLRRANFRRLMSRFEGRTGLLSDALEIIENRLMPIYEGQVDLDDERYGHLNPRLMKAGFPDGWLEQPNAVLTSEMVERLVAVALDDYERSYEEQSTTTHPQPVSASVTPVAAPAVPPAPVVATPVPSFIGVLDTKEKNMASSQPQFPPFAAGDFNAAGIPSAAPTLPRGVMSAGRPLLGAGAPSVAVTVKKTRGPKKATPVAAPAPIAAPAVAPTANAPRTFQAPSDSPSAAAAPAPSLKKSSSGKDRDASLVRAQALDKLLDTARRGAKVTLWRDLLGYSLPYWGNVRNGSIIFRDDLADKVIEVLNLPKGWLDNPQFPPATLAAWVTDPSVPLPSAAGAPAESGPAPLNVKPYSRKRTPTLVANVTVPSAPLVQPPAEAPAAPAAAPVAAAPAPVVVAPAAPVAQQALPLVSAGTPSTFTWTPAANPEPIVAPGPLTQALNSVLNQLATEGKFTEQDALRMLYFMMSQR